MRPPRGPPASSGAADGCLQAGDNDDYAIGYYTPATAGTLPSVAFVEPRFVSAELGTSNDDHPHADIRNGQAFLNRVYSAVTASPAWARTLLVINHDEWGGFFDHVAPTAAPIPDADALAGNEDGLRGFRVPWDSIP